MHRSASLLVTNSSRSSWLFGHFFLSRISSYFLVCIPDHVVILFTCHLRIYIYIYIYSAKQCITYLFLSSYTAFFIITLSTTAVTVCHSGCRLSMWSTYHAHRVDRLKTLYCNIVIIFTHLWVYHLNLFYNIAWLTLLYGLL